jgi:ribosomal protein S18 acetylase RimI-like enzyme
LDIHFASGQYNPHTPHGQSLLGHELTHVVQQRAGRVANPFGSGVAVVQDQALEAEADRMGRAAATHRLAETDSSSAPGYIPSSQDPGASVINRKANPALKYALRAPRPSGSGWQIDLAAQGTPQPVGSVQLTPSESGVYISNLKVAPEHRRHGLATQLIHAALRTARSNGHHVAQLEARPDSPSDVAPAALISMYRKLGFCISGISKRGGPLMERRT